MKAIGYFKPQAVTQADSLVDLELPKPTPTGRDLLINVEALSVNPVDTKVRKSTAPEAGAAKVLGWDAVGQVVGVGDSVENFKLGDKVSYAGDLTRAGSNAEFQLVDERIVGRKPSSLSNIEAAAMPLTTITAWELLFDRLGFTPKHTRETTTKKRILILGAAGGVGSILTQLAKKLTDATVIGTASRPQSEAWVRELGADYVINHYLPFMPQLRAIGIDDITHVISLNHTDQHFDQIVDVIAPQGKFALIDDPKQPLDIIKLKTKSVSLHWEFMYTRSMYQTHDMQKQSQLLNSVAELIDRGEIKTTLGENFGSINAANLKRAHTQLEANKAIGKIVLEGF